MLKEALDKLDIKYIPVDPQIEEKVVKLFKEDLLYEPTSAIEYFYIGVYQEDVVENKKAAKKAFKKAVYMGDINAMIRLGDLYKNHKKAKFYYKQAMYKGDIRGTYNVGWFYHQREQLDKAEKYYEKAAQSNYVSAMNGLGNLCDDRGEHDKALLWYEKAVKFGSHIALYNLAIFYENQKDVVQAEIYYRKALVLKHTNTEELDSRSDVLDDLTDLMLKQSRVEEAFLLASEYPQIADKAMPKIVNRLKYPISETNKDKIYATLETVKLPLDYKYNGDVIQIIQDVIAHRQKVMCEIAYHYKNFKSPI